MKRTAGIILIFIGFSFSLFSLDLSTFGLELKAEAREGAHTVFQYRLEGDGLLTVMTRRAQLRQTDVDRLKALMSIYQDFALIETSSIRIVLEDEKIEILLVPRSFVYEGRDLAEYMPSGIQFFYTDFLEYDFRIVVDNLFLRIRGQYFQEEEFAEKLTAVVRNPLAYIQTQDPKYIVKRFEEIERKLIAIQAESSQRLAVESSKLREGIEAGIGEVKDLMEGLKQDIGKLQTQLVVQEKRLENLDKEFQFLRYALLVLNNRGFFGTIHLPSEAGITRLVELKKQQPALTMAEAQIRLRAEGIEMSRKEVFLVYSVYFNEFK